MGYANLRKSPMHKERTIVSVICKTVETFWERLNFSLSHSVILIAGNAIKANIATEKTRITTVSIILKYHNTYVQIVVLLLFEEVQL